MKSIPKEYNSVVLSGFGAAALCGAAGYFVMNAISAKDAAVADLEAISAKVKTLQSKPASPTEAYLKELSDQKVLLSQKIEELRSKIREIDLPFPEVSPEDFPKTLNQKVRAFTERAQKESVQIPPEFYMGFDDYQAKGKMPPKQLAPYMARQLEAVSLILHTLLETQPLELRSFQRRTPDELPSFVIKSQVEAARPITPGTTKKAEDAKKQPQATAAPLRASLWAETYQIEFVNRPERLRTFLNKLASENKAFFVVRSIKVTNSQEFVPSKNPDAPRTADGAPGQSAFGLPADPSGRQPASPGLGAIQSSAVETAQQATGDAGSPYIFGEENVVVQMTVDLVSVVPPPANPEAKQP